MDIESETLGPKLAWPDLPALQEITPLSYSAIVCQVLCHARAFRKEPSTGNPHEKELLSGLQSALHLQMHGDACSLLIMFRYSQAAVTACDEYHGTAELPLRLGGVGQQTTRFGLEAVGCGWCAFLGCCPFSGMQEDP